MSKIYIDAAAGLCPGVKTAVTKALEFARLRRHVVSYGELIHNPDILAQLQQAGITSISNLTQLRPEYSVIVRAHGIPPADEEYLAKNAKTYLDLTCGIVKKVQQTITRFRKQGYRIVIIGKADHPEVIGHLGYAGNHGYVISHGSQAEEFNPGDKCLVIAQTTTSDTLFHEIAAILKEKSPLLEVNNTICPFVQERQHWIREYAAQCDAALIIGGKQSSNTGKLYEIAAQYCSACWVEGPADLDCQTLHSCEKIALTAGTSTPEESVNRIIQELYEEDVFLIFTG